MQVIYELSEKNISTSDWPKNVRRAQINQAGKGEMEMQTSAEIAHCQYILNWKPFVQHELRSLLCESLENTCWIIHML